MALAQNETNTNQTVPIVHEHEFFVDRTVFKPVTVQVNFPYTHSSNVSEITTIGSSLYKYQITPTSVSFVADDIDVYTFTIDVGYDNATRREILIGISQGDMPMEGYTWYETGVDYCVHFRLTMTTEPTYPSDVEVAQQVVQQLQQTFVQQLEAQRKILDGVQATSYTTSIVTVIAGVTSIFALLLAGFGSYKRRREPIEGV